MINININDDKNNNVKNNNNDISLPSVIIKKNEDEIKNIEHNPNNRLKLKTKNLKIALNDLDLINEREIREKNNLKKDNIDILKNI